MKLHPATLLLGWGTFAVALQVAPLSALGLAVVFVVPLCVLHARERTYHLIRRARWLLLSIAILFAFTTPGERLPGTPGDTGITYDGLTLGVEHLLRLLLLLSSLALLHERLRTEGLMAGLHWLLRPLSALRGLRERIVVRLMLVLDYVEQPAERDWRAWLSADVEPQPAIMCLPVARTGIADWTALAALALAALVAGFHA